MSASNCRILFCNTQEVAVCECVIQAQCWICCSAACAKETQWNRLAEHSVWVDWGSGAYGLAPGEHLLSLWPVLSCDSVCDVFLDSIHHSTVFITQQRLSSTVGNVWTCQQQVFYKQQTLLACDYLQKTTGGLSLQKISCMGEIGSITTTLHGNVFFCKKKKEKKKDNQVSRFVLFCISKMTV